MEHIGPHAPTVADRRTVAETETGEWEMLQWALSPSPFTFIVHKLAACGSRSQGQAVDTTPAPLSSPLIAHPPPAAVAVALDPVSGIG